MKKAIRLMMMAVAVIIGVAIPLRAFDTETGAIAAHDDSGTNVITIVDQNGSTTFAELTQTADENVFKGTYSNEWTQYAFLFYNSEKYGLSVWNEDPFTESSTLVKTNPNRITFGGGTYPLKATVNEDGTITLEIVETTPLEFVVDGTVAKTVEDINDCTADDLTYDITVAEGETKTLSVNIDSKSYGVSEQPTIEDNVQATAALTENGTAVSLTAGDYNIAVVKGDEGYSLEIMRVVKVEKLYLGTSETGTAFSYNSKTDAYTLTANFNAGDAPVFTYFDGTDEIKYHLDANIVPDGTEPITLSNDGAGTVEAKGKYVLTVKFDEKGTPTLTYADKTFKNVVIRVYDLNKAGENTWGCQPDIERGDVTFDYVLGDEQMNEDGSYSAVIFLALYYNSYPVGFFFTVNGVDYRPAESYVAVETDNRTYTAVAGAAEGNYFSPSRCHNYVRINIRQNGDDIEFSVQPQPDGGAERFFQETLYPTTSPDVFVKFYDEDGNFDSELGCKKFIYKNGLHYLGDDFKLRKGMMFALFTGVEGENGEINYERQLSSKSSDTDSNGKISIQQAEYSNIYLDGNGLNFEVLTDGTYNLSVFYANVSNPQVCLSKPTIIDRGLTIRKYNAAGNVVAENDMKYNTTSRINSYVEDLEDGEYVKFFYDESNGVEKEISFYNDGTTINSDAAGTELQTSFGESGSYRFQLTLSVKNEWHMSYQAITYQDALWLHLESGTDVQNIEIKQNSESKGEYEAVVTIKNGQSVCFSNGEEFNHGSGTNWSVKNIGGGEWSEESGDVWYANYTSETYPEFVPGHVVNTYSPLSTPYEENKTFVCWKADWNTNVYGEEITDTIHIDVNNLTMRFGRGYTGEEYHLVASCFDFMYGNGAAPNSWQHYGDATRFVYNPTTGLYTLYAKEFWGEFFINGGNGWDVNKSFSCFDNNNVCAHIGEPMYLSVAKNNLIITEPQHGEAYYGTGYNTEKGNASMIVDPAYGDNVYQLTVANLSQSYCGVSPVYHNVTFVFDPLREVLWLYSDRQETPGGDDEEVEIPTVYGDLYLVFTDDDANWKKQENEYYVKLTKGDEEGTYVSDGYINFPAHQNNSTHSTYFFSHDVAPTLAETYRMSVDYQAMTVDPVEGNTGNSGEYGNVYTWLQFDAANENFRTPDMPLSLMRIDDMTPTLDYKHWSSEGPRHNTYINTDEAALEDGIVRPFVGDSFNAKDFSSEAIAAFAEEATSGTTQVRAFASDPKAYRVYVDIRDYNNRYFNLVTAPEFITSGVEDVNIGEDAATVSISARNGHISVSGAENVSVYDVHGRVLVAGAREVELDVDRGIYVIVADGKAYKYAL